MDRAAGMERGRVEQQVAWHTVGIIGRLGEQIPHGIGTGVALKWRGSFAIVTAHHVIGGADDWSRIWFLFREGEPARRFPRFHVPIHGIFEDDRNDVALLQVSPGLAQRYNLRFYPLAGAATAPETGTQVVLMGYPWELNETLRYRLDAPSRSVEWSEITGQRPRADFDPALHFLVPYRPAGGGSPHGLSGAGVWYCAAPGKLQLAGIVTHYFRRSGLLLALRVEQLLPLLRQARRAMLPPAHPAAPLPRGEAFDR